MQGRLLPKYKGRYQAHPVGYWQNEFDIAASLNLNQLSLYSITMNTTLTLYSLGLGCKKFLKNKKQWCIG